MQVKISSKTLYNAIHPSTVAFSYFKLIYCFILTAILLWINGNKFLISKKYRPFTESTELSNNSVIFLISVHQDSI